MTHPVKEITSIPAYTLEPPAKKQKMETDQKTEALAQKFFSGIESIIKANPHGETANLLIHKGLMSCDQSLIEQLALWGAKPDPDELSKQLNQCFGKENLQEADFILEMSPTLKLEDLIVHCTSISQVEWLCKKGVKLRQIEKHLRSFNKDLTNWFFEKKAKDNLEKFFNSFIEEGVLKNWFQKDPDQALHIITQFKNWNLLNPQNANQCINLVAENVKELNLVKRALEIISEGKAEKLDEALRYKEEDSLYSIHDYASFSTTPDEILEYFLFLTPDLILEKTIATKSPLQKLFYTGKFNLLKRVLKRLEITELAEIKKALN